MDSNQLLYQLSILAYSFKYFHWEYKHIKVQKHLVDEEKGGNRPQITTRQTAVPGGSNKINPVICFVKDRQITLLRLSVL